MHLDMYGMVKVFPFHCRKEDINTVNCNNGSIEAIHSFTTPPYQDVESKYNEEGIHNCEQVFAYDMLQITNVFYLQMHLDMYGMVKVFPLHCRKEEINTVNCNNVLLYQVVYSVLDISNTQTLNVA
jgi:hypothetical protein